MNLGFGDIIARMEQAVGRVLTDCLLYLAYGALFVGIVTYAAEHVTTLIESPSLGRRALGWLLSSIVGGVLLFGAAKIATRRTLREFEEAQEVWRGYAAVAKAATSTALAEQAKCQELYATCLEVASAATSAALAEQAKCQELHATCLEWGDKIEAAISMEQNQP